MLIKFRFKNFLSFSEEHVFSMESTNARERLFDDSGNRIKTSGGMELLRSAVIYGGNASGKSNFIKALAKLKEIVLTSHIYLEGDPLPYQPFILNTVNLQFPVFMECTYLFEGITYRYGFEFRRNRIEKEWLFITKKRETRIFSRSEGEFNINTKSGILKELTRKKMVRDNVLLLSAGAQFNDPVLNNALAWFRNLQVISGMHDLRSGGYAMHLLQDPAKKSALIDLLKYADSGIRGLHIKKQEYVQKESVSPLQQVSEPGNSKKDVISMLESIRFQSQTPGAGKMINVPFTTFESDGTQKFFLLAGLILDSLENGTTLFIDEFDVQLHPHLQERIVLMFHNNKLNTGNAQLIFTTHNTHLLSRKIFRRDQVWLTERNIKGSTNIYSLVEFMNGKGPRNDERIEKNYHEGKYGGVPFMGEFDNWLETE